MFSLNLAHKWKSGIVWCHPVSIVASAPNDSSPQKSNGPSYCKVQMQQRRVGGFSSSTDAVDGKLILKPPVCQRAASLEKVCATWIKKGSPGKR